MPAELVQVCDLADYTPATHTCAAPYYLPQETGWPALSIADAQSIGAACALLWATAWGIRRLKRMIDQS